MRAWLLNWAHFARHPRPMLLEWAHRAPAGGPVFLALGIGTALDAELPPRWLVVTAAALAAPSVLLGAAGSAAHAAWERGWLLADTACPCCGPGDDDGGPDDDPGPDLPDDPDGYGLTPDDHAWLRSLGVATTTPETIR
jgi:hypothetical protein